ncbi:sigma-70 family RNA polymerase sigma factor [Oceanimonas baumannii]|uniref:sigma-70 family RNA polymerase sigma factor n=1 Tax=Oceanimonas baumannii TaxID=129578 RepID=UPI001D18D077|nr:sigma-70 family RNA polymerase sigma factor [Oceanimonas baumannii]MCC4264478.1 sigma-70 family RNA polymerase sigma factor [Oceanimonas baumannii]
MADAHAVHPCPLSALYCDHHAWLRQWLYGRLGNRMDAEDLAQDTFIRVIRAPDSVRQLREPRSYLVTIARGLTIDLFRKRSLERQYQDALAQLPPALWPSEEERALMQETLLQLDNMLAGLGQRVRQAFILSQFEGLNYEVIAGMQGVSLRTVKNDMAKAFAHCCLYRLEQW